MAAVAQPVQVTTFHGTRARRGAVSTGYYALLAALSLVSMFPFVWTFLSSGKTVSELYQIPPSLWPTNPQFIPNYIQVWTQVPFGRWLLNTFFVTVVSLIGTVISASLVGYSFARFRYPGRDVLFRAISPGTGRATNSLRAAGRARQDSLAALRRQPVARWHRATGREAGHLHRPWLHPLLDENTSWHDHHRPYTERKDARALRAQGDDVGQGEPSPAR